MPQFWRFGIDQDGEEQIKAISAYLWQESFDGKLAEQGRGNAANGKDLLKLAAVSPATQSAKPTAPSADTSPLTCKGLARS